MCEERDRWESRKESQSPTYIHTCTCTHTHPHTLTPYRFSGSTPTGEGGECFLVERCESDVEGEDGEGGEGAGVEAEQLLLTLSDRFLEEKSYATGKVS